MSYGNLCIGMFSWNCRELCMLMSAWLRRDVEGQRRVCYAHHLRTGNASVERKDGKIIYRGYMPPKSWR
jgi:hypothetical protein